MALINQLERATIKSVGRVINFLYKEKSPYSFEYGLFELKPGSFAIGNGLSPEGRPTL